MQDKTNQKASVLYNELESIAPFRDSFSVYLFKKTEKIVLALYLVTDHLIESDAMRSSVRILANEILKDGIKVTNRYYGVGSDDVMISHMYEVVSLLEISSITKLVSENNAHIIKEEIAKLAKDIKSHQEANQSGSNLKKSFFVVDTAQNNNVLYKGHKGHSEKEMSFINKTPKETFKRTSVPKPQKNEGLIKEDRSNKIMKVIQEKGQVTIKDVTETFDGISEKTIQRELQKMVSNGVLKKEGERRWSTYSLL